MARTFAEARVDELLDERLTLRRVLWLSHGCVPTALYGDDGEMQCSACGIDFKRRTAEEIDKGLLARGRKLLELSRRPRRAIRLKLEIEADTVFVLVDALVDVIGTIHETHRVALPPELVINRELVDRSVIVAMNTDFSMTPERYRQEMAHALAAERV